MASTKRVDRTLAPSIARTAKKTLDSAILLAAQGEDPRSVIILLINASIKASDSICVALRGEHWQGGDHKGAVKFLATVDKEASNNLAGVLANKTELEYGLAQPSSKDLTVITRAATALIERATKVS